MRFLHRLFLFSSLAFANVEKVIFLGPERLPIPVHHPNIDNLNLETIAPPRSTLRTQLLPRFPSEEAKDGSQVWLLVDGLLEGTRYEIRICWAATQPTAFKLAVYDMATVFDTPALITALSEYSENRQLIPPRAGQSGHGLDQAYINSSSLFLQILAAADYYSSNSELMENVPLVNVDIILDPFLFNFVPVSLIPTGAYIIMIALGSWFLSSFVYDYLRKIGRGAETAPEKKTL